MNYYLGVDIGASSGRHILSWIEDGMIRTEEIHRFYNGVEEKNGHLCWDITRLYQEILTGLKKCREIGKIPVSMGIDTWAVDYVLLDKNDEILGNTYAYRDSRTAEIDRVVYEHIEEKELYSRTGIQKQPFNTIYQLMATAVQEPELLEKAESMLMIPDYFHFLLTGIKVQEYTNATTTQLVNAVTKDWDDEIISRLSLPSGIFQTIQMPGTTIGSFSPETEREVGFSCKVVLPATHDTGSAILAVPSVEDDFLYISSGTWSLLGTELAEANCSEECRLNNLTNEGGYEYRFRFLKNIMGLWMIQSVKKEIGGDLSFGEICEQAGKCEITSIVDCNDNRFLAPVSMVKEVQEACRESGQQVPEGITEIACVIYQSLAQCYAEALKEVSELTGKTFNRIHIVGGGSNADYLNRLTAEKTGLDVLAGPTEATAIGNLAAQMLAAGEWENLSQARACIGESFPVKKY